jgi:flagella basal body P-ring formation protein FlgA
VIDRNEIVTLRFNAGGLLISPTGRALDRAAEGERLRVINLSSRVTVTARRRVRAWRWLGTCP